MRTSQPGIFALGTRAHYHLHFDTAGEANELFGRVEELRDEANGVAGVNLVVGFGPQLWRALAPDDVPDDFIDFVTVGSGEHAMPAAQHDLWLWLHGAGPDSVFDFARSAVRSLRGVAELAEDQPSFVYRASQDLTGFEDGTENPPIGEAVSIAAVADGSPGAGGNIVLIQRWVHDLDRFEQLPVSEQEQVFGRTLDGSVELDDEHQSPRSHVSRVVIEDDEGDELEVFRRSTSFGDVNEHGLVFVAFSSDRARLQQMLERMAGVGDGVTDHLTEYSRSTGGSWYYAPPVESLRALADGSSG